MAIPNVLMSLISQRPLVGGGPIFSMARWQFLVPLLPPGFVANFALGPPFGAYACIKYAFSFGSDMMPGSMWVTAGQGGDKDVLGYIMPDWQTPAPETDYYILFTHANPIMVQLTNDSNVNQLWYGTQYNIVIPNEAAFNHLIMFVQQYALSSQVDLARDANMLLSQLVTATGQKPTEPRNSMDRGGE